MKKILIDESLNFYKANLHCHSTISDGNKTVEELKRDYIAHGYSIIAFTDHEVYVNHDDLTDEKFLALNGYELAVNEQKTSDRESRKTCHICYIALDRNNDISVCFNKDNHFCRNAEEYVHSQHYIGTPDYIRTYSAEGISEMMKSGRKNGFFVTYNHPAWSLETYPQYSEYCGMNAMEINNFGCVIAGYDDDNGHCYDDLLNCGNKIFCIATDDNHNRQPDTDPSCDSYGGYTVITAPELEYSQITKALENGQFYSSTGNYMHCGPEIKSLIFEDGKVKIKTSDVRSIQIMHNIRSCTCVNAGNENTINEAEFDVKESKWFRLVVTDTEGYKAYTNAYFTDDLGI